MTVGDEQIQPTVVVEINELRAEAQLLSAWRAESAGASGVRELFSPIVPIECVCFCDVVRQ